VAHGVTTFFLSKLELAVEAFDSHEGVLYGGLHGNPELALLLAKLEGNHRSALDGRLASAKEGKGKRSLEKEIDKAGTLLTICLISRRRSGSLWSGGMTRISMTG
jgi:hypothetical protein